MPCRLRSCKRAAAPGTEPLEVCREHWACSHASSVAEAWEQALNILKPWVESTRAIGSDKLCDVMERALMEAEAEANLARAELERAETAAL